MQALEMFKRKTKWCNELKNYKAYFVLLVRADGVCPTTWRHFSKLPG
jgi:hypothetical protein